MTHKMTTADDVRFEFAGYDLALMQANAYEGDHGARAFAYENSLDERGLLLDDRDLPWPSPGGPRGAQS